MGGGEILVAIDASKEITDYAIEWAIRNVIKPLDVLLLLAVLPQRQHSAAVLANQTLNYLPQSLHKFFSVGQKKRELNGHDGRSGSYEVSGSIDSNGYDREAHRIDNVCARMMQQLLSLHKASQVLAEVKVVDDAQTGCVAKIAAELGAKWVIIDRRLKKEADSCVKLLDCNVVLVDHAIPKVLKSVNSTPTDTKDQNVGRILNKNHPVSDKLGMSHATYIPTSKSSTTQTTSTPDIESQSFSGDETSRKKDVFVKKSSPMSKFRSLSNPTPPSSNSHLPDNNSADSTDPENSSLPLYSSKPKTLNRKVSVFDLESDSVTKSSNGPYDVKSRGYNSLLKSRSDVFRSKRVKASLQPLRSLDSRNLVQEPNSRNQSGQLSTTGEFPMSSLGEANKADGFPTTTPTPPIDRPSTFRRVIPLSKKKPPTPPPLCSICKQNVPIFGKAPRSFSYAEIEKVTNGFSNKNLLAKGGNGRPVYRGVLADGLVVAVKQHRLLGAQGASEFCSEVEILSCTQHKNLVILVGYCTEKEWFLVYEFACNGSLDKHLYGRNSNEVMSWHYRMKVAVGAARGLRYLHEDCRVGCTAHRDFRPNNILLTHDFEPMVGDCGVARSQVDWQTSEEARVIGGYLAPECMQTGMITEKADVYSFGVVLLELLIGIRATEFPENLRVLQHIPEQRKAHLRELIDPRLEDNYTEEEAERVLDAAILCTNPHPERRPKMSKVLRMLEGDMPSFSPGAEQKSFSTGGSHREQGRQSRAVYSNQSSMDGYHRTDESDLYQVEDGDISPPHVQHKPSPGFNAADRNNRNCSVFKYPGVEICAADLFNVEDDHDDIPPPYMKHKTSPDSNAADRDRDRGRKSSGIKYQTVDNGVGRGLNQSAGLDDDERIVNDEYQQYLLDSLSKFFQNLSVK